MKTFTLFTLVLLMVSCSRNKHLTGDYERYAKRHSTLAVLPYDITVLGKDARELTPEQIDKMVLTESELFQQSLYGEVLKRTGVRDKDVHISVQDTRKTNRLLKEANITALNINEYTASEIGTVLGVDAVLRTRLVKEGFLNRETAMVADVVTDVIYQSTESTIKGMFNRKKLVRSSKVDIYSYIIDTGSDAAVWQYNTECDLSWDMEPSEVVESINRRISGKFPYRKG